MSATGDVNSGQNQKTNVVETTSSSRQQSSFISGSGEKRRNQYNRPGNFRGRYGSADGKAGGSGSGHFYRHSQNRPKDGHRSDYRGGYQGTTGEKKHPVLEIHDQEQFPTLAETKDTKAPKVATAKVSIQTSVVRPRNAQPISVNTTEQPRDTNPKPSTSPTVITSGSRRTENIQGGGKKNKKKFVSISIDSQVHESGGEFVHHGQPREGRNFSNFDDHRSGGGRYSRNGRNGYQRSFSDGNGYVPARGQNRRGTPRGNPDDTVGPNSGFVNVNQSHRYNSYDRQNTGYYNPRTYSGRSGSVNNRGYHHHNPSHGAYVINSKPFDSEQHHQAVSSANQIQAESVIAYTDVGSKFHARQISDISSPVMNGDITVERTQRQHSVSSSNPAPSMVIQQPPPSMLSGIMMQGYPANAHALLNPSSLLYSHPPDKDRSYLADDEVLELIKKQVEYYFSVENLQKDFYLRTNMTPEGYVNLDLVHKFNRVSIYKRSKEFLVNCLRTSPKLDVDSDGLFVRCRENPEIWPAPKPEDEGFSQMQSAEKPASLGSNSDLNLIRAPAPPVSTSPYDSEITATPSVPAPNSSFATSQVTGVGNSTPVIPSHVYKVVPPISGMHPHNPFIVSPHLMHIIPPHGSYRPPHSQHQPVIDSLQAVSASSPAMSPVMTYSQHNALTNDGSNIPSGDHQNPILPPHSSERYTSKHQDSIMDPSLNPIHHPPPPIYFYTSVQSSDMSTYNSRQPPQNSFKTMQFHPYFQNICYIPRNGAQIPPPSANRNVSEHPYSPYLSSTHIADGSATLGSVKVETLTNSFREKLSLQDSSQQCVDEIKVRSENVDVSKPSISPNNSTVASSSHKKIGSDQSSLPSSTGGAQLLNISTHSKHEKSFKSHNAQQKRLRSSQQQAVSKDVEKTNSNHSHSISQNATDVNHLPPVSVESSSLMVQITSDVRQRDSGWEDVSISPEDEPNFCSSFNLLSSSSFDDEYCLRKMLVATRRQTSRCNNSICFPGNCRLSRNKYQLASNFCIKNEPTRSQQTIPQNSVDYHESHNFCTKCNSLSKGNTQVKNRDGKVPSCSIHDTVRRGTSNPHPVFASYNRTHRSSNRENTEMIHIINDGVDRYGLECHKKSKSNIIAQSDVCGSKNISIVGDKEFQRVRRLTEPTSKSGYYACFSNERIRRSRYTSLNGCDHDFLCCSPSSQLLKDDKFNDDEFVWCITGSFKSDCSQSACQHGSFKSKEVTRTPGKVSFVDILLDCSQFTIQSYNVLRSSALKELQKDGFLKSKKLRSLFRFWSYFLRVQFYNSMYMEFKQLAKCLADKNERYGLECLFRFYSFGLEKRFEQKLFEDFQQETLVDFHSGFLYGLEKFWAFLQFYPGAATLTYCEELRQILSKFSCVDDFRTPTHDLFSTIR